MTDNVTPSSENPIDDIFDAMFEGLGEAVEIASMTRTQSVEACIARDFKGGNGVNIDHVLVDSGTFARLFEEGTIAIAHLNSATTAEGYLAVLEPVTFGQYTYPVKVGTPETIETLIEGDSLATMTIDNQVV